MANLNIKFNNKNFSIDPASLADATARLEAHLRSMMDEPDTPTEERLEGDGAEFYTPAPTALSFRSTAPLNELQEVQINGVTVDPSNYTLEEGSTIVTFPIDYLKTLNVGNYEVAVVSNSKSVKGGFNVKAPGLNEYGFYYNQPYSATVKGQISADLSVDKQLYFILLEDGTVVYGEPSSDQVKQATVTRNNNIYTISLMVSFTSGGTGQLSIQGAFSADGKTFECTEIKLTNLSINTVNFSLDSAVATADEDYVYLYRDNLHGYVISTIDKTKSEYGMIRTGINDLPTVGIGMFAFSGCKNLTSFKIPDNITSISGNAFQNCPNLESLTIPDTVQSIGTFAFLGCPSTLDIYYEGSKDQWDGLTNNIGGLNANIHYGVIAITTQPADTSTIDGSTVYFSVNALGAERYQWQYRPSENTKWQDYAADGYNTDSIAVQATNKNNNYQFRCIVKSWTGNNVISDAATLTILVVRPILQWNSMEVMNNTVVGFDGMRLVKVSDALPNLDEISNSILVATYEDGASNTMSCTHSETMGNVTGVDYDGFISCFVVSEAGECVELGITFPEAGIYANDYGFEGYNEDYMIYVPVSDGDVAL